MRFIKRKHNYILVIIFSIFIQNCQLQDPTKMHGINFLENREKILKINKTNKNDVISILGKPHTKSINEDNKWMYFERATTKGKYYKIGQNVLTRNNVLELTFNKYGLLEKKNFIKKKIKIKLNIQEKKHKIQEMSKVTLAACFKVSSKKCIEINN